MSDQTLMSRRTMLSLSFGTLAVAAAPNVLSIAEAALPPAPVPGAPVAPPVVFYDRGMVNLLSNQLMQNPGPVTPPVMWRPDIFSSKPARQEPWYRTDDSRRMLETLSGQHQQRLKMH